MATPLPFNNVIAASTSNAYSSEFVLQDGGVIPRSEIDFTVDNAAGAAVTACVLQIKDHANGAFYDYLSGSDWATATSNMIFATTISPAATHAAGVASAHVRVGPAYSCRWGVTLASGTGNVTIRASA